MNQITFVNVSHPAEFQAAEIQVGIRRHVMKNVGKARRRRHRPIIIPLQLRTHELESNAETRFEHGQEPHNLRARDMLVEIHRMMHPTLLAKFYWNFGGGY
ncbi:hypothetical protein BX600DRAFT_438946 [Xylariales sp. PMI_506]|nr:hypothetical protein BX600DRAFT_438946 [Xylariales sp. PMI_506]